MKETKNNSWLCEIQAPPELHESIEQFFNALSYKIRHARMIEKRIYICPDCQKSIRIETMVKPPQRCPYCEANMRGEQDE